MIVQSHEANLDTLSIFVQLPGMSMYLNQLKNVHTLDAFVLRYLFQYHYVYLSAAVIYIFDCFIKGIQAGKENFGNRWPW